MKYLIDTHTATWYKEGDKQISKKSINIIENFDNKIYFSVASLWEIVIKLNIKKLQLTQNYSVFKKYFDNLSFTKLDISEKYFETYLRLPIIQNHRDPFDRMLISQAITENIPILSADTKFDLYSEIIRIW